MHGLSPLLPDDSTDSFRVFHRCKGFSMRLGKQGTILLLCLINFSNYMDRGIIPGSPLVFQNFIQNSMEIESSQQSLYFGLLTSAFIASYFVFSLLFGYLSITHRPFRMIAIGLSAWIVSLICCGVAQYAESYWLLLLGRVLSGIGDASFQCNAAPFIDLHAPKNRRALWMGVFLSSITVGTASGYIYGSLFGSNWALAFWGLGVLAVFEVLACLFLVPDDLDQVPRMPLEDKRNSLLSTGDVHDAILEMKDDVKRGSFISETVAILKNIRFTLVVLGHGAYTFSLAALSVFAPALLIGLGFFKEETEVSTVFGGLIVITGTFGTPVGGIMLDKMAKGKYESSAGRSYMAIQLIFVMVAVGWVFAMVMMGFLDDKGLFLAFMAVCFFFLCALGPAETVAIMEVFPASRRSFAVALNTVMIRIFGDVPSPIILGWLKGMWAPKCDSIQIDGKATLNPDCPEDREGLRDVLYFPVFWMLWAVGIWALATFLARRHFLASLKSSTTPTA